MISIACRRLVLEWNQDAEREILLITAGKLSTHYHLFFLVMATPNQAINKSGLLRSPMGYTSAMVYKCDNELHTLANISLDKYANGRIKRAKMATGAFKYTFPFYVQRDFKRPFVKLWNIVVKDIYKKIPYIKNYPFPFIQELTNSNSVSISIQIMMPQIPLGRAHSRSVRDKYLNRMSRYIEKVRRYAQEAKLPLRITLGTEIRVATAEGIPRTGGNIQLQPGDMRYEVLCVKVDPGLTGISHMNGYYLIAYIQQIEEFLLTLHRLGIDSLEKTARVNS